MNILFAVIGIMLGGMLFHAVGAVSGGIIGWLCGGLNELRQRLDRQQQELAWLRTRLSEHLRDAPADTEPEAAAPAEAVGITEPLYASSPALQPPESPEWKVPPVVPAAPAASPYSTPEPDSGFSHQPLPPTEPSMVQREFTSNQ